MVHHKLDANLRYSGWSQVIGWEKTPEDFPSKVVFWRTYTSSMTVTDSYCRWSEGEIDREVRFGEKDVVYDVVDPEIENRRFYPQNSRRGLTRLFGLL